jgi:hypothetical protein
MRPHLNPPLRGEENNISVKAAYEIGDNPIISCQAKIKDDVKTTG